MFRMVASDERLSCLKTKAFLESQIFQRTEESAKGQQALERRWCLLVVHRSAAKERVGIPSVVQTCTAAGHEKNRCSLSSTVAGQRGHLSVSRMCLWKRLLLV